jgi:hypothetical protein
MWLCQGQSCSACLFVVCGRYAHACGRGCWSVVFSSRQVWSGLLVLGSARHPFGLQVQVPRVTSVRARVWHILTTHNV